MKKKNYFGKNIVTRLNYIRYIYSASTSYHYCDINTRNIVQFKINIFIILEEVTPTLTSRSIANHFCTTKKINKLSKGNRGLNAQFLTSTKVPHLQRYYSP